MQVSTQTAVAQLGTIGALNCRAGLRENVLVRIKDEGARMSTILLVGAGPMAVAYQKALAATFPTTSVVVAGRGKESAAEFLKQTGVPAGTGPLADQLKLLKTPPDAAVVAVQVAELPTVTQQLLTAGVPRILVEKPGAPTVEMAEELAAADPDARIRIAYNRRFLTSSQFVRRAVYEDGGVTSLSFEFTEIADRIAATQHPPLVKANWSLANSSHVSDLAFYLAGASDDLQDVTLAAAVGRGSIDWHPRGSRFAGCGLIGNETLFSYSADWLTGGGWAVEIATPVRRYIMRPLETVVVQDKGSFKRYAVEIPNEAPGIKPGLPHMLRAFLDGNSNLGRLPTAAEQAKRLELFERLLGG